MAQCVLLNSNDPMFPFVHAMEHRAMLGIMSPLTRFSGLPYFVEPMIGGLLPAQNWNLNHQSAQDDMLRNVPTQYAWQYIITTSPNPTPPPPTITTQTDPTITYGLKIGGDLMDYDLADPRQRIWWTWQNLQDHMAASRMVLPAPAPLPAPQTIFPFW